MNNKKILVVTGGKEFDEKEFYDIFSSFGKIEFDKTQKPEAFDLFASDKMREYSAIVFYDMIRQTDDVHKNNFHKIFERGIGCVFLHHSIVSHQDWDEYENILGGRYYEKSYKDEGKIYGPSTYKHDQDFNVIIIDSNHPITKGMQDFPLHDEIYINYKIHKYVVPILKSDNCESGKYIGWTNVYKKSRVVYLQPGHDHLTFENKNFRTLVKNSIYWVSDES